MKTSNKICRHALASHEGHGMIYFDEATRESLTNECCGGIVVFRYCPFCGENIHNWNTVIIHGRNPQKKQKITNPHGQHDK